MEKLNFSHFELIDFVICSMQTDGAAQVEAFICYLYR